MNDATRIEILLPRELRDFVQQRAAQEERSMAQVIRRLVAAEAARKQEEAA